MRERPVHEGIGRIGADEYAGEVAALRHVFLVGDLRRPTPHPFVRDPRLELVVVGYGAGDDGRFHWHPEVTEYEIVVEGEIGYREAASGETHWFAPGDLAVIPAGTCVERLVRRPARGVTVKVPSAGTKIHCEGCARECARRVAPRTVGEAGAA